MLLLFAFVSGGATLLLHTTILMEAQIGYGLGSPMGFWLVTGMLISAALGLGAAEKRRFLPLPWGPILMGAVGLVSLAGTARPFLLLVGAFLHGVILAQMVGRLSWRWGLGLHLLGAALGVFIGRWPVGNWINPSLSMITAAGLLWLSAAIWFFSKQKARGEGDRDFKIGE